MRTSCGQCAPVSGRRGRARCFAVRFRRRKRRFGEVRCGDGRFAASFADDKAIARPKRCFMFSYAKRTGAAAVCLCLGNAALALPSAFIIEQCSVSAFALAVRFELGDAVLASAVRFELGGAALASCFPPPFCRAMRPLSNAARPYGGRRLWFLRFLCASDGLCVSRKAPSCLCGGRALWDVSRETLTNAALCATIDTQNAGIAARNFFENNAFCQTCCSARVASAL